MKTTLTTVALLFALCSFGQIQIAFNTSEYLQVVDERQEYYLFEGNLDESGIFDVYLNDEVYRGQMIIATESNRYFITIGNKENSTYTCQIEGNTLIWQSEGEVFTQWPNELFEL